MVTNVSKNFKKADSMMYQIDIQHFFFKNLFFH